MCSAQKMVNLKNIWAYITVIFIRRYQVRVKFLHGILNFELDKHTRECRADFTIIYNIRKWGTCRKEICRALDFIEFV